jgi:hypothetical protein
MMVMLDSDEPPVATHELPEKVLCSIFPNPVHDKLSIKMQYPEAGEIGFSLYDLSGREMLMPACQSVVGGSASVLHWDLSGFSPGIYILKIRDASGIRTKKIVKF